MRLHTEIFVLADYATISREGKVSINGIFDELRMQQLPGGLARAFLVAVIKGPIEKAYKLTIRLERESDKNVQNTIDLDIHTGPGGKFNLLLELLGIGFDKEGDYKFVLYDGKEEIATTMIKVIHIIEQQHAGKVVN